MTNKKDVKIRALGLSKSFSHVKALQDVDLEINSYEVLAIVGDNGAGKTTLIKTLCGVVSPDKGYIEINNKRVQVRNPKHALELGIATVFQDLALVDSRDIASNVFLGNEPTLFKFFVDRKKMFEKSREVLNRLKIAIPSLNEEVGRLSGGQRQTIAVGRALSHKSHTVIMDEPTAALGVQESRQVLEVVEQLKNEGIGIIIISHNLMHVFKIADRIMVMRHGMNVGVRIKNKTSIEEIEKMIIGE